MKKNEFIMEKYIDVFDDFSWNDYIYAEGKTI